MTKKSLFISVLLFFCLGFVLFKTLSVKGSDISPSLSLAKVFNEDSIDFDRDYRDQYLVERGDFLNLDFEPVAEKKEGVLTTGAKNDNLKGYRINNQNFAVELIYCNSYEKYCVFRINGVPTGQLSDSKNFNISDGYVLKINSINFDFCDNKAFCHLGYEGYHLVNVSVEVKK